MGISRASTSVRKIGKTKIINRVDSNGHRSETRVTAVNTAGSTKTYDRVTTTPDRPKLQPLRQAVTSFRESNNNRSSNSSDDNSMMLVYVALIIIAAPFVLVWWLWKKYKESRIK